MTKQEYLRMTVEKRYGVRKVYVLLSLHILVVVTWILKATIQCRIVKNKLKEVINPLNKSRSRYSVAVTLAAK